MRGFISGLSILFHWSIFLSCGPFFKSLYWICYNSICCFCFGFGCQAWDLCSPTRDRTCTPCIGRRSLNHWTARESLDVRLLAFRTVREWMCVVLSHQAGGDLLHSLISCQLCVIHFKCLITLRGWYCYHPHFIDEETDTQSWFHMLKGTEL